MTSVRNDDGPKTFREVGYILSRISEDIEELKMQQKRLVNWLVTCIICPLVVGAILATYFQTQ